MTDRRALSNVLWSYKKKKVQLEITVRVDEIDVTFVLDIKNKLKGSSYHYGNNVIINLPFDKNSETFYKNLLSNDYWVKVQGLLNHEFTHHFDKEKKDEYHPANTKASYIYWTLYNTQETEMKAFIQQFMPQIKNGKSFMDCLDNRLKTAFKKDYTTFKYTLVKFVKLSYLSYIKDNKTMFDKYWKFIINDPNFSTRVPSRSVTISFFNSLR